MSIKHPLRDRSRRAEPSAPPGPPGTRSSEIRLTGVTVTREGQDVLRDVDLCLDEQRIAVIGLNGSGKSTLVRLLNGLLLPTRGTVQVGGLSTATDAKRIRRQVGFVFQNPENQIVMPLVAEDLAFGAKNLGLRGDELSARVDGVLERLGIAHLAERESYALSGGEKQLVALASVLVMEPSTIVFDEPTTMLDRRNRRRLQVTIDELDQRAVVVTHDLELIGGYDRVLVVHEGRIAFDGAPGPAVEFYCGISD
ncbi:energy-coupling factor ABC transporter ATP-binding protein [Kocuria rosea]|uniref:energy-coupling factor ABC transporter ATP-binding protein n=1 Tax=Kocuria rosea TaxID=1275 RepID=UPI002B2527B1|nr:ABC transporter ATP-binding protein [Kocuria rosea]MEB2527008.1 ABC transporter ATP-binding protein [Kocuria rosea]MEB2616807.1 ABC transporter ATP-binding protein [Kocuria rosea]